MFYAESTGGFYRADIHGSNIPSDAVEISDEQHAALLAAQAAGQVIQAGADGVPVAIDYAPSVDDIAATERAWRDEQLRLADIEINKLEDNGQDATAWRQYRQALRDVPTLKGFPTKFKRPVAPA